MRSIPKGGGKGASGEIEGMEDSELPYSCELNVVSRQSCHHSPSSCLMQSNAAVDHYLESYPWNY